MQNQHSLRKTQSAAFSETSLDKRPAAGDASGRVFAFIGDLEIVLRNDGVLRFPKFSELFKIVQAKQAALSGLLRNMVTTLLAKIGL